MFIRGSRSREPGESQSLPKVIVALIYGLNPSTDLMNPWGEC